MISHSTAEKGGSRKSGIPAAHTLSRLGNASGRRDLPLRIPTPHSPLSNPSSQRMGTKPEPNAVSIRTSSHFGPTLTSGKSPTAL